MRFGGGFGTSSPKALQWGRDVIVADAQEEFAWRQIRVLLQWGRDVIVADASAPSQSGGAESHRFNGAATLLSRMPHLLKGSNQMLSRFNGAATLLSRMPEPEA